MDKPLDLARATRLFAGAAGGVLVVTALYTVWIARVATEPWWKTFSTMYSAGFLTLLAFTCVTFVCAVALGNVVSAQAMSGWGRLIGGATISAVLAVIAVTILSPGWAMLTVGIVGIVTALIIVFAGISEAIFIRRPRWIPSIVTCIGAVLALAGLAVVVTQ